MSLWCRDYCRLFVGLFACGTAALEAQTLVTNGSFEIGVSQPAPANFVSYGVGSTALTGWTIVSDELALLNGDFQFAGNIGTVPSHGSFYLDLAGITDSPPHGGVQQGITTVPGTAYRLSFDLGTGSGASAGPVSLLASAGSTSASFINSNTVANWTTFNLDFVAASTTTMITLQGISAPAGNWYIGLDNVSVVAVPEPSVAGLLGAGLGALGLLAYRRRLCG